jgi:plasmid replication initiation protein
LAELNVNMSNALVRSAHGLNLAEKRIISAGLAKSDSMPARGLIVANQEGLRVKLTAAEYAETFEIDLRTAYEQLKEAGESLLKRQVRRLEKTRRGVKEIKSNWLSGATYHEGEGWVEIRFTHEVAPYLLALRAKFISYKLKQTAALRSIYAWRLFECLQSWKKTGVWYVVMEDFLHMMEAPESCRNDFAQLRRRVIEPAVSELSQKNGLKIEWLLRKAGRKVVGLEFRFVAAAKPGL